MSVTAVVVVVIAIVSLSILGILAVALMRHLKLLKGSLGRFRYGVQPAIADIQREAAAARSRLERLERHRSATGAGARLRR